MSISTSTSSPRRSSDGEAGVVRRDRRGACAAASAGAIRIETAPVASLPQGRGALLLHIGVGRDAFKRKHVVRGQAHDALGIDGTGEFAAGAECCFERFGGLVVGDDHDDGVPGGAGEERNVKGAGGIGESGHTTAPSREAEMPSHTLEAIGVLNAREGVANKG